ncbi:hypothetical protein [Priestia megaterium]|uniref:hypothetical protein n=1 Tax=Priestia megaterium TaxID=1404 RepID=UPI00221FE9BD|nr:hypothetical protein [Priestia megaterium]UYV50706.1 hypothetical protein OHU65_13960 [Priestia megaterium]
MENRKLIEALYITNKLTKQSYSYAQLTKDGLYNIKRNSIRKAWVDDILSVAGVHNVNLTLYIPTDTRLHNFSFHQVEDDVRIQKAYGVAPGKYNGSNNNIDWNKCLDFSSGDEKLAIDYVKAYVGEFTLTNHETVCKKHTKEQLLKHLDIDKIKHMHESLSEKEFLETYNQIFIDTFQNIVKDPTVLECLKIFAYVIGKPKVNTDDVEHIKKWSEEVLDICYYYGERGEFIFATNPLL